MFGDRQVIVTVTVTEETPSLRGLLAGVSLMTPIYGLILDEGMRRYFVDSWSDKAPSAIRSIRRSVARASPSAVWSAPGSFWFL